MPKLHALARRSLALAAGLVLLALAPGARAQQQEARLMRFPHVQGDKVAFVYGGDIWTVSAQGGRANRITSFDAGFELYPRISPDGRWIAFSGEYSGTRQIWLVPYEGGVPRQLTFYPDVGPMPPRGGYDNLPLDWTPDGRKLLVSSNRTPWGERMSRYFLVDPFEGGLETPLQIPEGGPASYSPDGTKLAYNIISREWRTWKRYRAGRQQDVYVYDLAADTIERITDFEGTDNFPMWVGERIYFTSDRSGRLNLWRYDLRTRETKQVTDFDDWDVLFPSRGEGAIAFQAGGWLYLMDTATEAVRRLQVELSDDRPWLRPVWKDGARAVAGFDVSPSAKRAVVEFRGELFDVPAKHGEARNLTRTPQRREHGARWSPDGRSLAYLAEAGEDYELFVRSLVDGAERQLTRGTGAWILDLAWSPDSERLLLSDKANRLAVVDVASGELAERDRAQEGPVRDAVWSPDGRWLAYTKSGANGFSSIWICGGAADGEPPRQVTSDRYDDGSPAWDPDGRYLYLVSARDFRFDDTSFQRRLYALLLRADVDSPTAPREDLEDALAPDEEDDDDDDGDDDDGDGEDEGDDENPGGDEDGKDQEDQDDQEGAAQGEQGEGAGAAGGAKAKKRGKEQEAPAEVRIDLEGLERRLVVLPGEPGDYGNLTGVDGGLLFVREGDLMRYDLEERESKEVLDGARSYMLTPDGGQVLYRHQGGLALAKAKPGQKAGEDALDLSAVRVRVVPQSEWRQMYMDAWRIMRDWFYDPAMHGVDWRATRDVYAPLVEHVAHRADLDFVLGELIGELNAGHTYVLPGEQPEVERVPVGVLGALLAADSGRYRIARIYAGEGWRDGARSPLAEPGVDAREGDYLLAIDGSELTARDHPYRLLENKVGAQVKLTLNAAPSLEGAREVVVVPAASELELLYVEWVERNRRLVDELSGGRIGYVHVPNTAVEGHRELFENFRPQARVKQAMIVDDRYNGGGFVPDEMIAALAMPTLNYWARREAQLATTPEFAFDGPMAMLINGYSSSGGDAFPYYFRKLGRGPLIGKKTWGGLIGYSGSPRLVDGGGLAVPSFSFVNTEGAWDVEAVGVAPDIDVFDDPTLIQAGREPILEAAVQVLLKELEREPRPLRPQPPVGPLRNR